MSELLNLNNPNVIKITRQIELDKHCKVNVEIISYIFQFNRIWQNKFHEGNKNVLKLLMTENNIPNP
jgi:hypothetical protein